jgi:hypothetical protein
LQEPQQHKVKREVIRSQQLAQQEQRQTGQPVVQVTKSCKEAEAAKLEARVLDKELQTNQLLGHSEDQGPLVETFQEGHNWPNHQHQWYHSNLRRHQSCQ